MADPRPLPRWRVVEIATADTHPIRRAVLRSDTPTTDVTFAEDDLPGVVHLGVELDGRIVATSTWIARPLPDRIAGTTPAGELGDVVAVQLRGMATATELQGSGIGAALIEAGCDHARSLGAGVVWANARDRALAFYRREGFEVVGEGFVDATTELPHHVVVRRL